MNAKNLNMEKELLKAKNELAALNSSYELLNKAFCPDCDVKDDLHGCSYCSIGNIKDKLKDIEKALGFKSAEEGIEGLEDIATETITMETLTTENFSIANSKVVIPETYIKYSVTCPNCGSKFIVNK